MSSDASDSDFEPEVQRAGSHSRFRLRFARATSLLTGYTVLVILWGAFVRATGSGAGCGSHWPLCNGEVVPRDPSVETLIEFSHRLSSGLLGVFVFAFVVFAFRLYPRGHAVRRGAIATLVLVLAEALIGAGLVRFEWVADDDSVERVFVMAFHLVNTFLLLGALSLTGWFAIGNRRLGRGRRRVIPALGAAAVSLLLVGSSGAITALGDTLVLSAGLTPEQSPVVAQLVRSRFYHPSLAIAAFALVSAVVLFLGRGNGSHRVNVGAGSSSIPLGNLVVTLFAAQLAIGAWNVYWKAPVALQLLHLALSNAIWIAFVVFGAFALAVVDKKKDPPPGRVLFQN
jgi:heme A synthase